MATTTTPSVLLADAKGKILRDADPYYFMYVAGGIGEMMAACVSHPLDVIKVRCQLRGELSSAKQASGIRNVFSTLLSVAKTEGITHFGRQGLYYGLSASVGRQAIFSTLRHGTFNIARHERPGMSLLEEIATASFIGGISALVANPCDVILVRMQADGHWPEANRRGYKSLLDGLYKTASQEGVATLWRGCTPTCMRACLVTSAQLPSYGVAKRFLLSHGSTDTIGTHFTASFFSGFVATLVTCPVDVVKTRVMNMQRAVKGAANYSSPLNCVLQTIRAEGITGLYKGFLPTFTRQVPHTICLWMFQEQLLGVLRQSSDA